MNRKKPGTGHKGNNSLYTYEGTRDVSSGRVISKNGRLQGQNSRPEKDRSLGDRGGFTNRNEKIGKKQT